MIPTAPIQLFLRNIICDSSSEIIWNDNFMSNIEYAIKWKWLLHVTIQLLRKLWRESRFNL